MNNRAFTISFIVALLAVSMVYSYVSSTEDTLKQTYGAEVPVVVAKENIKELDILNETNLQVVSVPNKYRQPGFAEKLEELTGSLAIAPIQKGEQITRSKLTQLGARTGLARQVAVGKRAITVRVGEESGVAHLIKPGDRVDVLAKIEVQPGHKEKDEVRTLLQDVLVLATGKYIANTVPGILEADPLAKGSRQKINLTEYTSYTNVTLEVDPLQAQSVAFIQLDLGGVFLSLRNNDDNMKEELGNVRLEEVLGPNSAKARDQMQAAEQQQQQQRQQALLQQQAEQAKRQQAPSGFQMLAPPGGGRK